MNFLKMITATSAVIKSTAKFSQIVEVLVATERLNVKIIHFTIAVRYNYYNRRIMEVR